MSTRNSRRFLWSLRYSLFVISLLCMAMSCVPLFRGVYQLRDLEPPALLGQPSQEDKRLILEFSEAVQAEEGNFLVYGGLEMSKLEILECRLILEFKDAGTPGEPYELEGRVYDHQGNELWFLLPFHGYNPDPAQLFISEFIVEHSNTRLEKVELLVQKRGNLGGLCLYNGMPGEWNSRIIFKDQYVDAGEFLIVHFRSQGEDAGVTGEIDEYGPLQEAADLAFSNQASAGIRDYWAHGSSPGLSDTNGVLALTLSPALDAPVLDAVPYSNRSYSPDNDYGSFGTSSTWNMMCQLQESGAWIYEFDRIRPEDCINPDPSTSTRSINRRLGTQDSDSSSDWYIVDTGESSFGAVNSLLEYEP